VGPCSLLLPHMPSLSFEGVLGPVFHGDKGQAVEAVHKWPPWVGIPPLKPKETWVFVEEAGEGRDPRCCLQACQEIKALQPLCMGSPEGPWLLLVRVIMIHTEFLVNILSHLHMSASSSGF
jgi:hypothetical protein